MKVLAIDTATPIGVVGLLEDECLVGESRISIRPGGGECLPASIDGLLSTVGWNPAQLDLIVVGIGPGSYTGIRVGMALARSMAYALAKPMIGVSTHEAMGAAGSSFSGNTAVLTDARRGEVYVTILSFQPQSAVEGPEILKLNELAEMLNKTGEPVLLLGDGARIYHSELEMSISVPCSWGLPKAESPDGSALARLGLKRWLSLGINEIDTSAPLYLRRVEAEIRLEEKGRIGS